MSLYLVSTREGEETQLANTLEGNRYSRSLLLVLEQPHLSSKTERDFWSAGKRDIP